MEENESRRKLKRGNIKRKKRIARKKKIEEISSQGKEREE